MHFVEEGEVHSLNFDLCLQVTREAIHYLSRNPVLTVRSLNEDPNGEDEKEQRQEEPQ